MKLKDLVGIGDVIDSVEIVSFKSTPPQYVRLGVNDKKRIRISSRMLDYDERGEVGALRFTTDHEMDPESGLSEAFYGGSVSGVFYLVNTEFNVISGLKIILDDKEIVISSGDFPYSLLVEFDSRKWGRPEYEIDEYEGVVPV